MRNGKEGGCTHHQGGMPCRPLEVVGAKGDYAPGKENISSRIADRPCADEYRGRWILDARVSDGRVASMESTYLWTI